MSAAPAAPPEEGDVVQAVFAGLEVLIPLLAADPALLRFPKLARGTSRSSRCCSRPTRAR